MAMELSMAIAIGFGGWRIVHCSRCITLAASLPPKCWRVSQLARPGGLSRVCSITSHEPSWSVVMIRWSRFCPTNSRCGDAVVDEAGVDACPSADGAVYLAADRLVERAASQVKPMPVEKETRKSKSMLEPSINQELQISVRNSGHDATVGRIIEAD